MRAQRFRGGSEGLVHRTQVLFLETSADRLQDELASPRMLLTGTVIGNGRHGPMAWRQTFGSFYKISVRPVEVTEVSVMFALLYRFACLLGLIIGLLCAPAHALGDPPAQQAPANRAQALQALESPLAQQRLAAVARLGDLGTMADADRLASHLRDANAQVRQLSGAALWQIWSRSGDKGIDALYQQGVEQMEASKFREAVATFTAIIARRPAFAEAWNKRATLYYLLGELDLSLKDCDEVIMRNPNHFGALSGVAQIYLKKGDLDRATSYFERALKVNPNLEGIAEVIEQLQKRLEEKRRNTI